MRCESAVRCTSRAFMRSLYNFTFEPVSSACFKCQTKLADGSQEQSNRSTSRGHRAAKVSVMVCSESRGMYPLNYHQRHHRVDLAALVDHVVALHSWQHPQGHQVMTTQHCKLALVPQPLSWGAAATEDEERGASCKARHTQRFVVKRARQQARADVAEAGQPSTAVYLNSC